MQKNKNTILFGFYGFQSVFLCVWMAGLISNEWKQMKTNESKGKQKKKLKKKKNKNKKIKIKIKNQNKTTNKWKN